MADRNLVFGSGLTIFGATLSLGAYFLLENTPLTAMGIGLTVLGMAWALTPPHPIPKNAVVKIVKSSIGNIEALLEATGAISKAVYLPSKGDGKIFAYIPLKSGDDLTFQWIAENSNRVVLRRGGSLGIMVIPPRVEYGNPEPDAESGMGVNDLLSHVLVDTYEVAESVKSAQVGDVIVVDIYRSKIDLDYPRFNIVMGSFPSCIAAQAVASAISRPVQIVEEKRSADHTTVRLRLMNWTDTPSTSQL
ncbi:MAG: hypothetical protein QXV74_05640 [Candidatus Bathyarchaeia archaeon]